MPSSERSPYTNLVAFTVVLAIAIGIALVWERRTANDPPTAGGPAPKASVLPSGSRQIEGGVPATGEVRAGRLGFEIAVYHLKSPPAKAIEDLAAALTAAGMAVERTPAKKPPVRATVTISTPPIADLRPPPLTTLKYAGRGTTEADQIAAQTAQAVTVLDFASPTPQAYAGAAALLRAIVALEKESPGLVWDAETRLAWRSASLEPIAEDWARGLPHVRKHVNMHAYPFGESIRIVTLGMAKLGLPDLAVEGVAHQDAQSMSDVLMLTAQTLVERSTLPAGGVLAIDRKKLVNAAARAAFDEIARPDTTGDVVHLVEAEPKEGDADNRLLTLVFPGNADTVHERHAALVANVLGRPAEVYGVKDDDPEMLAARARAKKKLMLLKPIVALGLPEGAQLNVKGPFATPSGGTEWMWVEVTRWQGTKLEGILQSDPFELSTVKRGSRVSVEEGSVFDYRYSRIDGSVEGEETDAVVRRGRGMRK